MNKRFTQIPIALILVSVLLLLMINSVQANNNIGNYTSEEILKDQLKEVEIAYTGLLDLKDNFDDEGYSTTHIQNELKIIESLLIDVSEQIDKGEHVSAQEGISDLKSRIVSAASSLLKSRRKIELWCAVLIVTFIVLLTLCIFLKQKNLFKK